jgi:hypothetical protein
VALQALILELEVGIVLRPLQRLQVIIIKMVIMEAAPITAALLEVETYLLTVITKVEIISSLIIFY